jgi:nitrate/nitrite-specific signal transduction histidine kinase
MHAYREETGEVHVVARAGIDQLWVLVTDDGCGYTRPARTPGLGFGLPVIADAADECGVAERPNGGTEVQLRFLMTDRAPTTNGTPASAAA